MQEQANNTTVRGLVAHTSLLWIVAIAFFGAGDMVTTAVGLSAARVVEAGPLSAVAIHRYGLGVMIPLKLGVFALGYALWRLVPHPHNVGVPLGLAVFGVLVTGWNLVVLTIGWYLTLKPIGLPL